MSTDWFMPWDEMEMPPLHTETIIPKHGTGGQTMTRDELIEKIDITKKAIMFAGPVHRRDLQKHLKRMTAQLRQYDRFQADAQRKVR